MPSLSDLEAKYFPLPFSGTPHSQDTVVIPHVDGDAYFAAIADAIDQCYGVGSKIYISSWFFNDTMEWPERNWPFSTVLARKVADYGVDVRIIIAVPRFSMGIEGRLAGIEDVEHFLYIIGEVGFSNIVHKNVRAARGLRASDPGGGYPLSGRVLMDWGGVYDSRHEKSTVVYSANTNELRAFVGGMDYSPDRMSPEIHTTDKYWHDVGVELRGGAAAAVLGNFRTRWEEAASLPERRYMLDGVEGKYNPVIESSPPSQPTNPEPAPANAPPGGYIDASVRIIRSYDSKRAYNPWMRQPDLPWKTLPTGGVQEILATLQKAISAARRYIYVEDQTLNPGILSGNYITHALLMGSIAEACRNGVKVIFVTDGFAGPDSPVSAHLGVTQGRRDWLYYSVGTSKMDNFASYYVENTKIHSKVVLVDDEFASIGSANFWDRSMTGEESELNAAIVHAGQENSLVADLRVRLWRGHLRVPSSSVMSNDVVDRELRDLSKSLAIFRQTWGTGITFMHPNSALRLII